MKTTALALILALAFTAEASAHAKLLKSDPPANGAPTDGKTFELTFSEAISSKLSGAALTDAAGGKVASTATVDQGGKGMKVVAGAALKPGAYTLAWHAVASDDGHRTTGTVAFAVK